MSMPKLPNAISISRYLSGKKISKQLRNDILWYHAYIIMNKWRGRKRDCPYVNYNVKPGDKQLIDKAVNLKDQSKAKHLIDLVLSLEDLFDDVECYKIAILMVSYPESVVRDYKTFKSKVKSDKNRLIELIRYIFCKYTVPRWFNNLFYSDPECFIIMNSGDVILENINTILANNHIKGKATKSISHYTYNAPADTVSFDAALIYGMAKSAKCDSVICNVLRYTRFFDYICYTSIDTAYALLQWLAAQPMFNLDKLSEIVDYLVANRNVNIHGRTINSLIRLSDEWHNFRDESNKALGGVLPPADIKDFMHVENKKNDLGDIEIVTWTINSIKTGRELKEEGMEMHHCVASYASSIMEKKSFIFSIKRNGIRAATIELRNNSVSQFRGKFNSIVVGRPRAIFEKWVILNKLRIARE